MLKKVIKVISLILIVILLSGIITPVVSKAAEDTIVITFKDKNLYNGIVKNIGGKLSGKNDDTNTIEISRGSLSEVKRLGLYGYQIQDISGLSNLTNLEYLYLDKNQIQDISGLSNLTNLEDLYLNDNQIQDISGLSNLTNLRHLYLNKNQIQNISALSGLTELGSLSIYNNQIQNIDALSGLTKLVTLELTINQIQDISALSGLTNLENLYLDNNQIQDISALSDLTNLKKLSLNNNKVQDINALSNLTKLEYLLLKNNNQIQNISVLSNLTNLERLYLCSTEIQDISVLSGLTKLEDLSLAFKQIQDINALSGLTNLKNLYLGNGKIQDISALSGLTKLEFLSLEGNQIRDISILSGLTELSDLRLEENQIQNISALSGLTKLKRLDLSDNQIQDISMLPNPAEWLYFYLKNNQIYTSSLDVTINKENIPNVFREALDPQSIIFSEKGLSYENCSVNENGDIVIDDKSKKAIIRIIDGKAKNTTWHIKGGSETIKFPDENLYKAMKDIMKSYEEKLNIPSDAYKTDDQNQTLQIMTDYIDKIDYLDLIGKNISSVSGLEEFTNLHTLSLDYNKIRDIDVLSQLPLDTLTISDNNLQDFSKLTNLKNVKALRARNNNFENINSIENLTNLDYLDLAENKITDISGLSKLPNIEYIHLQNNKITDVSVLESNQYKVVNFKNNNIEVYGNPNINKGYFYNNEITKNGGVDVKEYDLPDIFVKAMDSSSKIYTPDALVCKGCEIQGNKVIVKNGEREARVVINDGYAIGTTLNIIVEEDYTPPSVSINYNLSGDKSKMTVKITANEDIRDIWGWKRIDEQTIYKEFEYNVQNENVGIEDLYGNATNEVINFSGVTRYYGDEGKAIQYFVKFSTEKPTNQEVTVSISSKEPDSAGNVPSDQESTGELTDPDKKELSYIYWVTSDDGKSLVKTFSKNTNTTAEMIGTGISIPINIANIDKEAPDCTVRYSSDSLTNSSVVVSIVTNEDVQTPRGWSKMKSNDKYILYKIYFKNKEENITVYDLAGNSSEVNIKVANIDEEILNLMHHQSTYNLTNDSVNIKVQADENIQEVNSSVNTRSMMKTRQISNNAPEGNIVAMSEDAPNDSQNTIEKIYTENTVDAITVKDSAGNEDFMPVSIYNIDKTELVLSEPEYIENADGTVTVKINANKTINPIDNWNGWNLDSSKKTLSKVYSSNKKEKLTVTDLAGNEAIAEIDVNTINPGLEILSVEIEKVEKTNKITDDNLNEFDTGLNENTDDEAGNEFEDEFSKHEHTGGYKVTITASNELKEISEWKKSFDGRSISKLFSKGEKEMVEVEDYYGNKEVVEIDVNKLLGIDDDNSNNNANDDKDGDTDNDSNGGKPSVKPDDSQSKLPLPNAGGTFVFAGIVVLGILFVVWNKKNIDGI